jgi:hypothetical protein
MRRPPGGLYTKFLTALARRIMMAPRSEPSAETVGPSRFGARARLRVCRRTLTGLSGLPAARRAGPISAPPTSVCRWARI